MKRMKRMSAVLLSLMMIVLLLPTSVLAQGAIDLTKKGQIELSYQDDDISIAGAEFDLHLVADVDEYGNLKLTDTFAGYPVRITDMEESGWRELASTLEGYILRDEVTPTEEGKTDEKGILTFSDLSAGLYLIHGERHTQNDLVYTTEPFLVMVPTADNEANDWEYEVSVHPKNSSEPVPEEPISVKVLKVWKDNGKKEDRPKEITVALLCDGKVYEEIALHEEDNWKYTWEGLSPDHSWTVVEKEADGYTTTVTKEGITFVVTNTPKEDTPPTTPGKDPTLPDTGQLWWPVPILLCVGLLFVVIGLLRRRGAGYEK